MDLIKRARDKSGKIFHSMSPDVFTGIIFSFLTEEYIYCHEPLAINGASVHSTGTAGFEKAKRRRSYDPADKFWNEPNIPFHKELPLMPNGKPLRSIAAVFYEAFLQAEAFYSLKLINTSKERQLKIILNQSGPDHNEIIDWGKLFAEKHNIYLGDYRLARKNIFCRYIDLFIRISSNGLTRFKIEGSLRIPLQNVYQASIAAGLIKELKPNIFQAIRFRLKNSF